MQGLITTRDVMLHGWTIIEAFGPRVYFRCLVRLITGGGRATFLECVWSTPGSA